MKKTIALSLCLCCTVFSYSQLRIAILGGGHQSTVIETNDRADWDSIKGSYQGRIGIHAGFLADLPLKQGSRVSFQPGVIFYQKGRKYNKIYNPPQGGTITQVTAEQFTTYFDVPLNLVFKFGKKAKFIIGGGPYASFIFGGREKSQTITTLGLGESTQVDDLPVGKKPGQYEVINYGVNGLAGIEIGRVFITGNYSRGLNDFYHPDGYTGSLKHQVIGGTLGIFLGNPVQTEKKPKDKDKDGIPDDKDQCPDAAGPAITQGCPDKDSDGIPDATDQCPDQPGTVAYKGCPATDRDKDGIPDADDKCPDQAGTANYKGCPVPDSDNDGVNDEADKCPNQPGTARYNGCPVPDSDGDGINDDNDKCPNEKGRVDYNGCPPPEIKKEVVEKVNYAAKRVQFQSGKAVLTPASLKVLDEVAAILKQDESLQLAIDGHTSADGSLEFNMRLSEQRAAAVKNYLVSRGVATDRLQARGFGPTRPLNTGKTVAERNLNRRVEMSLSN